MVRIHLWMMVLVLVVGLGCAPGGDGSLPRADRIRVFKGERRLELVRADQVVADFKIALGSQPRGHKAVEGDGKTPEGKYVLDYKKVDSSYYRAIHISYPNARDRARAEGKGMDPGGLIMIHGQPNGWGALAFILQRFDWTQGCIALSNGDMDRVWQSVVVPLPIEILP
ncbi:MAG: L,D-transpeptidase family protein [Desulfobacterales bacterium]|nr:L,D-transpeptidase family protein [Desulfobacterales bacterium]